MIDRSRLSAGFRLLLLGATALASQLPASAMAAADDEQQLAALSAEAFDDSVIIVTGTRRITTLMDAPINISALGAGALETNRITNIREMAGFVNGLTVYDSGPRSAVSLVMRGISAATAGGGGASGVSTYLGEVPLYFDFKLLDMQRVEVLRGPQGTLYGAGTLAGALRYIPNRPNAESIEGDVYMKVSATDHSGDLGYTGHFTLNTPIVEGHIAFRTTTGYFFEPGFIDYNYVLKSPGISLPQTPEGTLGDGAFQAANFTPHRDVNFDRTFTTRNQLLLQTSEDLKATITYAYQKTTTDGGQSNSAGAMGTGNYESTSRYVEPMARDAHMIALEIDAKLGDIAQFVSSTAYSKRKSVSVGDNTDLLLDLDYDYELFPGFSSYAPSSNNTKQLTQEVRLVSAHGGPISWTVGAFYNKTDYSSRRDEYIPGYTAWAGITTRPDDLEYISFSKTSDTEKAVFGEASWKITDAWQVTGGLRHFKYDASSQGGTDTPLTSGGRRRTPYPLIQFDPSRIKTGSMKDSGTVYKLNTSYKFSDDLMAYATYSTGYRIGGPNRVAPCVLPLDTTVQNVCALPDEMFYAPDETTNYEIGARFSLLDRKFSGAIALFHIDWNGIQVPGQTQNGGVGITKNGSKAQSRGVEVEMAIRPFEGFTLSGNYSYTDAHLTALAPGIVGTTNHGKFDGLPGDRLPGSVQHQGSVTAQYVIPVMDESEVRLSWAATYRGDIYTRVGNRGFGETVPDFWLHRASVGYSTGPFEFTAFANNIFNKYAISSVGDTTEQIGLNDGVVMRGYSYTVIRPRTMGFEARFRF